MVQPNEVQKGQHLGVPLHDARQATGNANLHAGEVHPAILADQERLSQLPQNRRAPDRQQGPEVLRHVQAAPAGGTWTKSSKSSKST
ncbi:unnamed protein product [Effrenium voratum]|uniref:Uncharacterized protein n=1 Tax=Effrenium voratum TaxID=2562239 RepID=A0AA36JHF3_9DINO|nr:unnamed protein product [Effrenium voratum]